MVRVFLNKSLAVTYFIQIGLLQIIDNKKTQTSYKGWVSLNKSLAVTYFHMGTPTLSSALSRFTSEFGMDSGGTNSLWPPGISVALLYVKPI